MLLLDHVLKTYLTFIIVSIVQPINALEFLQKLFSVFKIVLKNNLEIEYDSTKYLKESCW